MNTSSLQTLATLLFAFLSHSVFSQNVPASAVGHYSGSGTVSAGFAAQYALAPVNVSIDLSQDGTVSVSMSSTTSGNAGVNGCAFTATLPASPLPLTGNLIYVGSGSATMSACSDSRLNGHLAAGINVFNDGSLSLTGNDTFSNPNGFVSISFTSIPKGSGGGGGPTTITPTPGIWWNPDESGTGYALEVQHGVLAILIFSYQTNGSAQWYYVTGALNGNSFTSTLDKYTGGQCISYTYNGRPVLVGNDGSISIQFLSTTTATLTVNGQTKSIQHIAF
jgi:hypothetical protein